jgi:hypothetical protein
MDYDTSSPRPAGRDVGVQMVKPWKRRSSGATMGMGKGREGWSNSPNRLAESAAFFSNPGFLLPPKSSSTQSRKIMSG